MMSAPSVRVWFFPGRVESSRYGLCCVEWFCVSLCCWDPEGPIFGLLEERVDRVKVSARVAGVLRCLVVSCFVVLRCFGLVFHMSRGLPLILRSSPTKSKALSKAWLVFLWNV